jgi:hypothetical protein
LTYDFGVIVSRPPLIEFAGAVHHFMAREIDGMRFSGMIEIERTDPRVWVEEELIGEIEDPFEAVKSRLHWH